MPQISSRNIPAIEIVGIKAPLPGCGLRRIIDLHVLHLHRRLTTSVGQNGRHCASCGCCELHCSPLSLSITILIVLWPMALRSALRKRLAPGRPLLCMVDFISHGVEEDHLLQLVSTLIVSVSEALVSSRLRRRKCRLTVGCLAFRLGRSQRSV